MEAEITHNVLLGSKLSLTRSGAGDVQPVCVGGWGVHADVQRLSRKPGWTALQLESSWNQYKCCKVGVVLSSLVSGSMVQTNAVLFKVAFREAEKLKKKLTS